MKEFDVELFASKSSTTTNENEEENKKTSSHKSLKLVRVPELCRKGIKLSCMKERLPTDHKFFYRSCSFYSACDYWLKYRNRLDTIRIAFHIEEGITTTKLRLHKCKFYNIIKNVISFSSSRCCC
jgi:hypothetical protein